MNKTACIRFMDSFNEQSTKALLTLIEQKLKEGATQFVLLMSSPGGSVFHGLSAYNYLKGIPAEVVTHNFGSVNSVALVVYCAGVRRLCVPHGMFLLHGVVANFPQGAALEEKQLQERLNQLRLEEENIAGVVAANTGKTEEQVVAAILDRTTLNPEEAMKYGLVHEIREHLFEQGWELHSIGPA
jgi:ATP-dependent Clp protease protease subunit